jgi:hypothetical protein
MARRGDDLTMDLLEWRPPEVARRYDERAVSAASWRDRIARAVAETLRSAKESRDVIAARMTEWLGHDEPVSGKMLDAYASQAKEAHTIPYLRVIALGVATGDARLLQLAAEPIGHAVIEARFLGAIHEAMATERLEEIERARKLARRQWRGRV